MTAVDAGPQQRVEIVRRIFIGGLAGMAAGFLVGGVGGRLAMRSTSLIDRSSHGARTEAGFTVGEVTLGGSLELVVFIGIFGGLAVTAVWPVIERWLPRRGLRRYGAAGVSAVAVGGRLAIDGRNIDFQILDPGWLMASIFVVLTGLVGVVAVVAFAWLDRHVSRGGFWERAWPGVIVLGILPAAVWVLLPFDSECNCVSRPWLALVALYALGIFTVVTWVREFKGGTPTEGVRRGGQTLLAMVVLTGLAHLGGEIAHFV